MFGTNILPYLDLDQQIQLIDAMYILQNSRHYKKISGNFAMIRDPMYKYSKSVKERLLMDNYMAFFWMMFRTYEGSVSEGIVED